MPFIIINCVIFQRWLLLKFRTISTSTPPPKTFKWCKVEKNQSNLKFPFIYLRSKSIFISISIILLLELLYSTSLLYSTMENSDKIYCPLGWNESYEAHRSNPFPTLHRRLHLQQSNIPSPVELINYTNQAITSFDCWEAPCGSTVVKPDCIDRCAGMHLINM